MAFLTLALCCLLVPRSVSGEHSLDMADLTVSHQLTPDPDFREHPRGLQTSVPVAEGLDLQKHRQNLISATTRPRLVPCVGSRRPGHSLRSLSHSSPLSGSRPAAEGPGEGEAEVPTGWLTAGSSRASLSPESFSVGCSPAPVGPPGQDSHVGESSCDVCSVCLSSNTRTHTCTFSRRYAAQCWGMPDVK